MSPADLLDLFLRFASLSMLAIGGAIGMAPEMRRFMVDEHAWISGMQFTDSIVIAQAAPGPNILFVTLLGWQAAGTAGAAATTLGMLLPSSIATWWGWRLKRAREDSLAVGAIRMGLSPIAIGLTASAGWVVATGANQGDGRLWVLTALSFVIVVRTRLNMLWLIGAGALAGALGIVG